MWKQLPVKVCVHVQQKSVANFMTEHMIDGMESLCLYTHNRKKNLTSCELLPKNNVDRYMQAKYILFVISGKQLAEWQSGFR